MEDLTLIIPVKNESKCIPTVLSDLDKFNCKKIIVIDPLDNETFEVAKKFNCKIIKQKNRGYGKNQKMGYLYSIVNSFDVVVMVHGDGQFGPEKLEEIIEPILKNKADAVLGSRMKKKNNALKKNSMNFNKKIENFSRLRRHSLKCV